MAATLRTIEELYRRRYPHFLRVAAAIVGRERARDAVQEAFARAIRSRRSYRGEGDLEAWVWRMVTNVCLSEARRREPVPPAAPAGNGHAEEWPELRAAVAALPERQRLVLFLRHYADLDYEQIAAVVGVERGTVAATLSAAHANLRKTMTEVTT